MRVRKMEEGLLPINCSWVQLDRTSCSGLPLLLNGRGPTSLVYSLTTLRRIDSNEVCAVLMPIRLYTGRYSIKDSSTLMRTYAHKYTHPNGLTPVVLSSAEVW